MSSRGCPSLVISNFIYIYIYIYRVRVIYIYIYIYMKFEMTKDGQPLEDIFIGRKTFYALSGI